MSTLLIKLNDIFTTVLDHPAWRFRHEEITINFHRYKEGEKWTKE